MYYVEEFVYLRVFRRYSFRCLFLQFFFTHAMCTSLFFVSFFFYSIACFTIINFFLAFFSFVNEPMFSVLLLSKISLKVTYGRTKHNMFDALASEIFHSESNVRFKSYSFFIFVCIWLKHFKKPGQCLLLLSVGFYFSAKETWHIS